MIPKKNINETILKRTALLSVCVAIGLTSMKFIYGYLSSSLSIFASSVDSFFDVFASLVNFFALKESIKPPDNEHKYGHGKVESLASLFQAILIVMSGIYLLLKGIKSILYPSEIFNLESGIIVMTISVVSSVLLTMRLRYIAKKYDSAILKTDSMHYLSDIFQNLGVLGAVILIHFTGLTVIDGIIGALVGVYVIWLTLPIASNAFKCLTDHELPNEVKNNIVKIINSTKKIESFHNLRTRKSGMIYFIDFHIVCDDNLSLIEAHKITHNIEEEIHKIYPHAEVLIHIDPYNDHLEDERRAKAVYTKGPV